MGRGNSKAARSLRKGAKDSMRGMSRAELERAPGDSERCERCGGVPGDGNHVRAGLEARWTCAGDLPAAGTGRGRCS